MKTEKRTATTAKKKILKLKSTILTSKIVSFNLYVQLSRIYKVSLMCHLYTLKGYAN
jgi:hypothetical protein